MLRRLLGISSLAWILAACAARPTHELAASTPEGASRPVYDEPAKHSAPAESATPPAGARAEAGAAYDADSGNYRPGLATSWGESHRSNVTSVFFERQSEAQPTAWARVQYDNAAGVAAATGQGRATGPHHIPLLGGALWLSVVDDDQDALPSVFTNSSSYVIAEHGERYQLLVENRSATRFEIVATVDGLDVLDGRPGDFGKRGYLVNAHDSLVIEGFRTSDTDVAAFRFGSVADSYAAARGGAQNVGVIGVAAFAERFPVWRDGSPYAQPPYYDYDEVQRRQNAQPFPGRYATPPGY